MKTYAPKDLRGEDLRGLLENLFASPLQVAKFLRVTERSVWRWLADGTAPYSVLAALWHETPQGRECSAADVGNELVLTRVGKQLAQADALRASGLLSRVLQISDTGAANEPVFSGSTLQLRRVLPLRLDPITQGRQLPDDGGGDDGPTQHDQGFADHVRPAWK
jgi:hypothetical protein